MEYFGEQFLHEKNPKLHTTELVEHEQERKKLAGEKTTQKPKEKLAGWMSVLDRTHAGHREEPEVLGRIKAYYHRQYVIKEEDIPEGYYDTQRRIAREHGHGDIEITEEMKAQLAEAVTSDQQSTLDNWLDYFISSDSDVYPMWAKYWAFTNMLKLSTYDKERHVFAKRTKGTVAPFPDLNREALAYAIDSIEKKRVGLKSVVAPNITVQENDVKEFEKILEGENFGKLYAWAIEKVTPTEQNELLNTEGEWVKYDRGSDHMPLVQSLQGHGTGWCTAGESTAEKQLEAGDFYVYYSYDKTGKPTIPRVAIRMQEDNIGEVRGIAAEQNLDPYIGDVVKEKLKEFPDGEQYEKKASDMKRLTEIEKKTKNEEYLTKEDLRFLYELDSKIQGFGYKDDPRIEEVKGKRDLISDCAVILDCSKEDILMGGGDMITDTTKVFSFDGDYIDYHILPRLRPDMKVYSELLTKPIEFKYPASIDYLVLSQIQKEGNQLRTLNPEMFGVDLERAKVFVPDLSGFNGKPLSEVFEYVVRAYGDTHHIPGLEYESYVAGNSEKIADSLKDKKVYFLPGSVFQTSEGLWSVPCVQWLGSSFDQDDRLLHNELNSGCRVVLLEK